MKTFLSALFMILVFSGVSLASSTEDLFGRAQAAYDDGRYGEAAMLYEKIIESGINNPEVHYNLGNACFKNNELPNAAIHYRKASYDLPRDPDIKANLGFALNAAGAIAPQPTFIQRFLGALTSSEWVLIATAGYLLSCTILLVMLFVRASRRLLVKVLLFPAAMILLAFFGWRNWKQLELYPEWVVTKTEATALFGPVEGSTAHFKLPLAALVKQKASDNKGWVEIEYDGKQGWLKQDYISRVSP